MLYTLIYKFKKRELTDTPPDITATNSNWDIVESELSKMYTMSNTYGASVFGTMNVNEWVGKVGSFSCQPNNTGLPSAYPISDCWGTISITGNRDMLTQTYIPWNYSDVQWVRHCRSKKWSEWKEVATTEKINITLQNKWIPFGDWFTSNLCTMTGKNVIVNATVKDGIKTANTVIMSGLPKPQKEILFYVKSSDKLDWALKLNTLGELVIDPGNVITSAGFLTINISYSIG